MKISTYLKKQKHRDDPIGDLARDFILSGDKSPGEEFDQWDLYLFRKGACFEAHETLKELFREIGRPVDDDDDEEDDGRI